LALIIAQNNAEKVGAIVDVSVFHDNSLQWEPNNKLFDVDFDWHAIKGGTNKLLFVHSDDDPYVPLAQAQYVANNCNADLVMIPTQGHFNLEKSEDYRKFPRLLEIMKQKGVL